MSPNTGELKMRSSGKRANKPLMEKKRRERINGCLVQLKTLVMESLHQEGASHTKLEKADILEMTVKYLEDHKLRTGGRALPTEDSRTSYREGYHASVMDMTSFLRSSDANASFRTRLLQHMGNRLHELRPGRNNMTRSPNSMTGSPSSMTGSPNSMTRSTNSTTRSPNSGYNDENIQPAMDFVDGVTSESSNDSSQQDSPHKIKFEVLGNIPLQPIDGTTTPTSPLTTSQTENINVLRESPSIVTSMPQSLMTSYPTVTSVPINDSGFQVIQATQIGDNVIVLPRNNLQQGQYRILQIQNHSSPNNNNNNAQIIQTNGQIFQHNGGVLQSANSLDISPRLADDRMTSSTVHETFKTSQTQLSQTLPSINTFSTFQQKRTAPSFLLNNHVTSDVTCPSTNPEPTYTVLQPMRGENVLGNGGFYGHYDQDENVWRPWSKSEL